ncbi:MAG: NF038129 family PEP-CTERM protein [Verrucomicrobiota bacterium]
MKSFTSLKRLLPLLATFLLLGASLKASVHYHVTVNTASLLSDPSAPFALDFQLNGGGLFSNTAIISNFDFGGGSPSSDPSASTFGLATGSLGSSVTLATDSLNAFNEFFQGFIPGSYLKFDVRLGTNINTPTPDAFSFSILDNNLQSITTDGLGNSLLLIDITDTAPVPQIFSSISSPDIAVAVPEPVTTLVGFALVAACGAVRHRRFR